MKTKILLFALLFGFFNQIGAQQPGVFGMYQDNQPDVLTLAEIDPVTGQVIENDLIEGVGAYAMGSSTFDQSNRYYIFLGVDTAGQKRFYVRDVVNNQTAFSPPSNITVNDFQYDMNAQVMYALGNYKADSVLIDTLNGIYLYEYASRLMAIDIETGAAEERALLPNLKAFPVGNSTFDANNGRYIVSAYDSLHLTRLFVIDAGSGEVISQAPVNLAAGQHLNELEYNNEDNKLYGIYRDNNQNLIAMAAVDLQSGSIEVLDPLNSAGAFIQGGSVFDQMNQYFYFFYIDGNGQNRMLTYDVANGETIADAFLNGTFTELEVDNSAYAALKYGSTGLTENSGLHDHISISPVPALSDFTITCDSEMTTVRMIDMTGKEIYAASCPGSLEHRVLTKEYRPGIYFVSIETEGEVFTKKVVIR